MDITICYPFLPTVVLKFWSPPRRRRFGLVVETIFFYLFIFLLSLIFPGSLKTHFPFVFLFCFVVEIGNEDRHNHDWFKFSIKLYVAFVYVCEGYYCTLRWVPFAAKRRFQLKLRLFWRRERYVHNDMQSVARTLSMVTSVIVISSCRCTASLEN